MWLVVETVASNCVTLKFISAEWGCEELAPEFGDGYQGMDVDCGDKYGKMRY